MKRNLDILFVLLATGGILMSQERFDYKVRDYFFAGFSGDAASLDKGMKICEDLIAANPKNAPAMVWHGAGLFFESGQSFRSGDQKTALDLCSAVSRKWTMPRLSRRTICKFASRAARCFSPLPFRSPTLAWPAR